MMDFNFWAWVWFVVASLLIVPVVAVVVFGHTDVLVILITKFISKLIGFFVDLYFWIAEKREKNKNKRE